MKNVDSTRFARSPRTGKLAKSFARFYGRKPDGLFHVDFTIPKGFIFLGNALAVEYRSDKKLGKSRRMRSYRHVFGKGVKVFGHPDRKWLMISGGKFRITDWLRG